METGFEYMISKEGLIKLLVIALGCVTFALLVDTREYRLEIRTEWVFAAFIVSCAISVLLYIFRLTGVYNKMGSCGPCKFDGLDFLWSWFSLIWCLVAAVAFATAFPPKKGFTRVYNKLITALVFAFATGIVYAIEAYILRSKAPGNIVYISTKRGWLKTIIVALGCAELALLVDTGYAWCLRGSSCCVEITYTLDIYALVACVVAWAVTTIVWIMHIIGPLSPDRRSTLTKFEFCWAIIGVLLFFSASACFAAYMKFEKQQVRVYPVTHDPITDNPIIDDPSTYVPITYDPIRGDPICQQRLGGVIVGFITGVLYIVEAVINKPCFVCCS